MTTQLDRWLDDALAALRSRTVTTQQIDADQILGPDYAPPWDLGLAMSLFLDSLPRLESEPWIFSLAIPLKSSVDVETNPPQRSTLDGDLNSYSPPGFYLLSPTVFVRQWPFEEYRRPLDEAPPLAVPASVNVRYSCFRSLEGMKEDWEWDRVLWLDRWPDAEAFAAAEDRWNP